MADPYSGFSGSITAPASSAYVITPSDVSAIDPLPRAIRVGTGGDIIIRAMGSSVDVTLKNVADGETIPIRCQYIRATGTTATDIVGLL